MDQLGGVTARLDELAAQVATLEARVRRLERTEGLTEVLAVPGTADSAPAAAIASPGVRGATVDLALVGRGVIVLGGGYLLRALTDLDAVPDPVGVAVGLLYALALLGLADRATARGATASGALHAATSLMIAYPLVGEMTLRFGLADPWLACAWIVGWGGAAFLVAWRRRALAIAWIGAVATLGALMGLAAATHTAMPFAWTLVALAAATGWLAQGLQHRFLVWPVAAVADLLLVGLLLFWERVHPDGAGDAAIAALALAFFAIVAAGAMARAIVARAATTVVETTQCSLALAIAVAGAVAMHAPPVLAAAMVALAVAGTVAALRWLAAREGDRRTPATWTTLWLAAAIAGLALLAGGAPLALAYLALALAELVLARRRAHELAEVHLVVALAAAGTAAGLLAIALRGLIGPPGAIPTPGPIALLVLAATAGTTILAFRSRSPAAWPAAARAARVGLVSLSLLGCAGVLSWAVISATGASRAIAATLRTGVLSAGATGLAAATRATGEPWLKPLVYALLAAGALKLFVEDFAVGGAATQFAGLAILGLALTAAPRLFRTARPA